jgi:hypothetical protein
LVEEVDLRDQTSALSWVVMAVELCQTMAILSALPPLLGNLVARKL